MLLLMLAFLFQEVDTEMSTKTPCVIRLLS
jgi:hypothetical protein